MGISIEAPINVRPATTAAGGNDGFCLPDDQDLII